MREISLIQNFKNTIISNPQMREISLIQDFENTIINNPTIQFQEQLRCERLALSKTLKYTNN